jgi:nucleoside-diphosphate-sugar epimerase
VRPAHGPSGRSVLGRRHPDAPPVTRHTEAHPGMRADGGGRLPGTPSRPPRHSALDPSAAAAALNWRAAIELPDGLAATIAWYRGAALRRRSRGSRGASVSGDESS